jgi:hypothetical protein
MQTQYGALSRDLHDRIAAAEHPTDKVLIVLEFGITNSIGDGYAVLVEMSELDKSQVPERYADSI